MLLIVPEPVENIKTSGYSSSTIALIPLSIFDIVNLGFLVTNVLSVTLAAVVPLYPLLTVRLLDLAVIRHCSPVVLNSRISPTPQLDKLDTTIVVSLAPTSPLLLSKSSYGLLL